MPRNMPWGQYCFNRTNVERDKWSGMHQGPSMRWSEIMIFGIESSLPLFSVWNSGDHSLHTPTSLFEFFLIMQILHTTDTHRRSISGLQGESIPSLNITLRSSTNQDYRTERTHSHNGRITPKARTIIKALQHCPTPYLCAPLKFLPYFTKYWQHKNMKQDRLPRWLHNMT